MTRQRCPSCGKKTLRLPEGTPPAKDQVCGDCAQESWDVRARSLPVEGMVTYASGYGVVSQSGMARSPRVRLEEGEARVRELEDGEELPF